MQINMVDFSKRIFSKKLFEKKLNRIIAAALAVIILFVILLSTKVINLGGSSGVPELRKTKVVRGNITNSVTGSGALTSTSSKTIAPNVNGKVTKIYFKQGDKVKAGDLLYELDDTSAKLNVDTIKNNMQQTQLQQDTNVAGVNNLTVTAPYQGQVTNITVKKGDSVGKNSPILTITDNSKLKLILPFNTTDAASIKIGQSATVYIQNFMQTVTGKVTSIDTMAYSSTNGGQLCNVELAVDNPGSIKDGMKANADIDISGGTVSSVDNGVLTSVNSMIIRSIGGGTVTNINVQENQIVKSGTVLVGFKNDDLVMTTSTTDLKLQNLQAQVDSAEKQLQDYKIYSPISGTIIKRDSNIVVGGGVTQGQQLDTIVDGDHMEFTINVDELDISKIKVEQDVNVTVDALQDTAMRPLAAKVSEVALEGTSTNGVATYPVKVTLTNTDTRLKGGMNANASILIDNKQNVLMAPIEAVQTMGGRSFVYVVKGTVKSSGAVNDQSQFNNANGYNQGNTQGNGGQRRFNNGNGYNQGGQQGNTQQSNTQQGTVQQENTQQSNGQNGNNNTNGYNQGNRTRGNNGGYNQGNTQRSSEQGQSSGTGTTGNRSGSTGVYAGAMRNNPVYQQYYKDAELIPVQVGVYNNSYIEITSGLSEGDEVILPPIIQSENKSSSSSSNNGGMNIFGGLGGGGNMRMPSGGNNNGYQQRSNSQTSGQTSGNGQNSTRQNSNQNSSGRND